MKLLPAGGTRDLNRSPCALQCVCLTRCGTDQSLNIISVSAPMSKSSKNLKRESSWRTHGEISQVKLILWYFTHIEHGMEIDSVALS